MRKLLTRPLWWIGSTKNLLKNFGIINPNIVRNLRYFLIDSAFLSFMRVGSTIPRPTPTPRPT